MLYLTRTPPLTGVGVFCSGGASICECDAPPLKLPGAQATGPGVGAHRRGRSRV